MPNTAAVTAGQTVRGLKVERGTNEEQIFKFDITTSMIFHPAGGKKKKNNKKKETTVGF